MESMKFTYMHKNKRNQKNVWVKHIKNKSPVILVRNTSIQGERKIH